MKVSKTISSLKSVISQWRLGGQRIGFIPTMGHLHAGHIELVNQARSHCDKVVVSIFVNPLQFNEASDFEAYPKTLDMDQKKLISAKTDLLFLPDNEMMYTNGRVATTKVCVPEITQELEGEHRPGHFDGVSTVVNKLFNLVQPRMAFFGEKDYQQLLLVRKMVDDLNMPVKIQAVPTHREEDGLAMSSRNSRLLEDQRKLAPELYKVLQQLVQKLEIPDISLQEVELAAEKSLKNQGFEVEYVSVRDAYNLQPVTAQTTVKVVLAAARLGKVRLIDNIVVR